MADYDCDEETWEEIWDFIAIQTIQGWSAHGGFPLPAATTSGLEATVFVDTSLNPDVGRRRVQVRRYLTFADSTTRIASISIDYQGGNIGNSNVSPAASSSPRIRLTDASNIASAGNPNLILPDGTTNGNFDVQPEMLSTYYILCQVQFAQRNTNTSPSPSGAGFVTRITVRGTGKNPFVA